MTVSELIELRQFISSIPAIDNHAHNLIVSDGDDPGLECIVSEAEGEALQHAPSGLALMQAVQQLSKLYHCEATWESIKRFRIAAGFDKFTDLCFKASGIECILMDDLFSSADKVPIPFSWHDRLTKSKTRRIVRVETLAENIIKNMDPPDLKKWVEQYLKALIDAAKDPDVVGFKSVICYRTGLDVDITMRQTLDSKLEIFLQWYTNYKITGSPRLQMKPLNDMIANLAVQIAGEYGKPIQFHTGLGDNDILLVTANPAYLQRLIEAYPKTKFVILHSSYPYTREAGYLATVYDNVYFDFGEAIPMLSPAGQRSMFKQVLELSPTSKILFSTDGHWYPETYYLGAFQAREVLTEVLGESVSRGEMTLLEAKTIARNAFFDNSNSLYELGLEYEPLQTDIIADSFSERSLVEYFESKGVDFVRIQWVDYCNLIRFRVFPLKQFFSFISSPVRKSVGITKAGLGLIQIDMISPGFNATGEYFLMPDLKSIRTASKLEPRYAYVMGQFEHKFGDKLELGLCPRTILNRIVHDAKKSHDVTFLVGFESEVVFIEDGEYPPVPVSNHAWSTSLAFRSSSVGKAICEEVYDVLTDAGIVVEQFHAESAPGQYEIVTGPLPPVESVDALVLTRDVIYNVAAKHGVRATFYPKVYANACGTASHIHVSLKKGSGSADAGIPEVPGLSVLETEFIAGLMNHLKSVVAFTLPTFGSYERLMDGTWAGGTDVCWGVENREAPVRVCPYGTGKQYNFEVKCFDGTANPYLGLAAVLAAGMIGVNSSAKLDVKHCQAEPSKLSTSQKAQLGIVNKLPRSLLDAWKNLRQDNLLTEELGEEFVKAYLSVKETEFNFVNSMKEDDRHKWMLERI